MHTLASTLRCNAADSRVRYRSYGSRWATERNGSTISHVKGMRQNSGIGDGPDKQDARRNCRLLNVPSAVFGVTSARSHQ
jgi:hypothetical protein